MKKWFNTAKVNEIADANPVLRVAALAVIG